MKVYPVELDDNNARRLIAEWKRRGGAITDVLRDIVCERLDTIAAERQAAGRAKFAHPVDYSCRGRMT